jgi:hypothetical protein
MTGSIGLLLGVIAVMLTAGCATTGRVRTRSIEEECRTLNNGEVVLTMESLRRLAVADDNYRMTYSLAAEMGQNTVQLTDNPFRKDDATAYRPFIRTLDKVASEPGLTPELQRLRDVARWRLDRVVQLAPTRAAALRRLAEAKSSGEAMLVVAGVEDDMYLLKRVRQRLEGLLIAEIRQDPTRSALVLADLLPSESSYSARLTLYGTSESGAYTMMGSDYPEDGPFRMRRSGFEFETPSGDASVHRYACKATALVAPREGGPTYVIDGDPADPAAFALLEGIGYAYLHGRGTVTFPDGRKVKLREN